MKKIIIGLVLGLMLAFTAFGTPAMPQDEMKKQDEMSSQPKMMKKHHMRHHKMMKKHHRRHHKMMKHMMK